MKNYIEFKDVNVNFKPNYYAVLNFNYKFYDDKNYLICGENLSGKSTLVRTFCGLEKHTSGDILINENRINYNDDFYKNEIVFLPTNQVLFENKTVLENLKFAYYLRNEKNDYNFENVLKNFNLYEIFDKKVKKITVFDKILLSLARASLREFTFLVIDECLDCLTKNEFEIIFEKLNLIKYKSLIVTTKNANKFTNYNFEILKLNAGYLID